MAHLEIYIVMIYIQCTGCAENMAHYLVCCHAYLFIIKRQWLYTSTFNLDDLTWASLGEHPTKLRFIHF